ncbi:MAG: hypothetical protein K9I47_12305 [Bacteroidales bacterium]|nr:hypothetical protein [Bacteroidales bacterium]
MKPSLITIVCVGKWNKDIFTPDWVAENLLKKYDEEKEQIQVAFNPSTFEIGYNYKDVILQIKDTVIEIRLQKINDFTKEFGVNIYSELIELLPHTPIKAIGINIKFDFDTPKPKLLNEIQNYKYEKNDLKTERIQLVKSYSNHKLNVFVDFVDNKYKVSFNYHFEGEPPAQDKKLLDKKIEESLKYLENG